MRLWYLSHKRPAMAQASLRIRAVSQEPLLFADIKYGSRRRVRSTVIFLALLNLKNEYSEDEKYHHFTNELARFVVVADDR